MEQLKVRNSNKLTADDMLLMMELANKQPLVVEREEKLLYRVCVPEARWVAYAGDVRMRHQNFGDYYFTGWTRRHAVRKAFQKIMIEDGEEKNT
jgi:hypothetical protein